MAKAPAPKPISHERRSTQRFEIGSGRYFDPQFQRVAQRVNPGDYHVDRGQNVMLVTTLGSCVAACVRDPISGVGGMNHFMLPESQSGQWSGASETMRYGNYAMEILINEILKTGALRRNLEIKLFGGAQIGSLGSSVGETNAHFALNYLADEGFRAKTIDLGGALPRRVYFIPETGQVKRRLLRRKEDLSVFKNETKMSPTSKQMETSSSIELF